MCDWLVAVDIFSCYCFRMVCPHDRYDGTVLQGDNIQLKGPALANSLGGESKVMKIAWHGCSAGLYLDEF